MDGGRQKREDRFVCVSDPNIRRTILEVLEIRLDWPREPTDTVLMPAMVRKSPACRLTAQKRAAKKAEEVARLLHSFATALNNLDVSPSKSQSPTPRNWWKLQAGRFSNDSSFDEFVAQVQAARRQEG
jgi:hypothetical protein